MNAPDLSKDNPLLGKNKLAKHVQYGIAKEVENQATCYPESRCFLKLQHFLFSVNRNKIGYGVDKNEQSGERPFLGRINQK